MGNASVSPTATERNVVGTVVGVRADHAARLRNARTSSVSAFLFVTEKNVDQMAVGDRVGHAGVGKRARSTGNASSRLAMVKSVALMVVADHAARVGQMRRVLKASVVYLIARGRYAGTMAVGVRAERA